MKKTGIFYHPVCGQEACKSLVMSGEEGYEILKKAKLLASTLIQNYGLESIRDRGLRPDRFEELPWSETD